MTHKFIVGDLVRFKKSYRTKYKHKLSDIGTVTRVHDYKDRNYQMVEFVLPSGEEEIRSSYVIERVESALHGGGGAHD